MLYEDSIPAFMYALSAVLISIFFSFSLELIKED